LAIGFGANEIQHLINPIKYDLKIKEIQIFSALLIAPLIETFILGFAINLLKVKSKHVLTSIAIGIGFGLVHGLNNAHKILPTTLIFIGLSLIYLKTNNIYGTKISIYQNIYIHFLINLSIIIAVRLGA
jgi:Type II CAAX prenyl endopeptidase Rce1-like